MKPNGWSGSVSKQGGLGKRLAPSARVLRRMFNMWPTFGWAGVQVLHIADDFTSATVELKLGWLNRNYVGTAFGGTLYSMTDPFFMIMMLRQLGNGYVVWDKAGQIRYRKPGTGRIRAEVRAAVAVEGKLDRDYHVVLRNEAGEVVAEVTKTLNIRKVG
jgi:acyl-coenzyme A thioesterase PaaI-like protein